MRGRPFVVVGLVGLWVLTFILPLGITLDLLVMCYHLTYVYHLTSSVLSPDHLACSMARPYWYDLTYPDYYQSLDITCHLIIINLLYAWLLVNYHHPVMLSLYTQHDILDL